MAHPPAGTQSERLTHQHSRLSYPVVLDRHTLAYLATDADGSGPWMYVLDLEQRRAHRVSSGLENFTSLAASADGRKLVATISTPRDSLWRCPLRGRAAECVRSELSREAGDERGHAARCRTSTLVYICGERRYRRHLGQAR